MVDAAEAHIARLDAQHEERMREKKERRDKALEFLDPTENANVFWQVTALPQGHLPFPTFSEKWCYMESG